jgi:hypothetical protein
LEMAGLSDASSNRRIRGHFTMPGDLLYCHDFQAVSGLVARSV